MSKIKNILFAILPIIVVLVSTAALPNGGDINPCDSDNNSFQDGEHIVYKIYYNWNFVWVSAGEVDFKITEKEDVYLVEATGKTYKSYDIFFKVRDYYKTIIDKETLLPIEFERTIQEGGYRFYNKIEFNQKEKTAISYTGRTREDVKAKIYPLDNCMHDVLSTVYFLRNLSFSTLKSEGKVPVEMFMDDEVYPIQITYLGEEEKDIKGLGNIETIKISPALIAGMVFSEDSQMDVWVSNDDNKVPLVIESPISVGSIQAILKEHNGLKYPLVAK